MTHTKIVATIGPASADEATLRKLIAAGMSCVRLNFSHGTQNEHRATIGLLRRLRKELAVPLAILADLQGPKIRIGVVPKEGIQLADGAIFTLGHGEFQAGKEKNQPHIPLEYAPLLAAMQPGFQVLFDDGNIEATVERVEEDRATLRVVVGGTLTSHKGIMVPKASLTEDPITQKDREDLAVALQSGVEYVALSFVRSEKDIVALRKLIEQQLPEGMPAPKIVAKIERREALEKIDAILQMTDVIMVARGDLGLAIPQEQVPIVQKDLVLKAVRGMRPVIVATHLLESMKNNPRPTRAEISDVANAVIDHTDAAMLSAESASGKYPVRAVETLAATLAATEHSPLDNVACSFFQQPHEKLVARYGKKVCDLAAKANIKASVVVTHTGLSALAVAHTRSERPVIALTDSAHAYHQLALVWGVMPVLVDGEVLRSHDRAALEKAIAKAVPELEHQNGSIIFFRGIRKNTDEATVLRDDPIAVWE